MSKKLKNKIYKYVHELTYAGVDEAIIKNYSEYLLKLAELTVKIDKLSVADANGNLPKLSNSQIRNMQKEYTDLIVDGNDLIEEASNDSHKKAINYVIKEINKTLTAELVELSNVMTTESTDMNTISEKAGSVHVDITGADISLEGGNQSARMPITFTDRDGKTVSGYFTENTVFDSKKDYENLIDKCAGGNQRYKEVFTAIMNNKEIRNEYQSIGYSRLFSNRTSLVESRKSLNGLFNSELIKISNKKNKYLDLSNDKEFNIRMLQFLKGLPGVFTKRGILTDDAGVSEGSVLDERNAAMTAMADLLEVPNLLARSVKMNVKNGDKTMSGVFMEKAVGTDLGKVTRDDMLSKLIMPNNGLVPMSGNAKKQLCDLQVLDYICGNVDRHKGNMMFTPARNGKKVVLDSIQGIDNDCSFGVLNGDKCINGFNRMKGLKDLNHISEDMMNHIMMLTPDILKTTLRPFNIKPEQINACIDRVKMLQEEIMHHTEYSDYEVVSDKDWDKVELDGDDEDYLGFVAGTLSESIVDSAASNTTKRYMNSFLKGIDKRLVSGDTEAEGRVYNSDDERKRESDETKISKFKSLERQLKSVKKGVWNGSKAFDNVEEAFNAIAKLDKEFAKNITSKQMNKIISEYEKFTKIIDTYLDKKEKEKIDLLKKGDAPSKRAIARTEFANGLKEFVSERIESLKFHINKRNDYINDVNHSLNSNIRTAEEQLKLLANDENIIDKNSMQKHLEATIIANKTLMLSIEEHKDQLTDNKLSEMVSPTNQDKLIEKTESLITKADSNKTIDTSELVAEESIVPQ